MNTNRGDTNTTRRPASQAISSGLSTRPDPDLPDAELPDTELPNTELPDAEQPGTELPPVGPARRVLAGFAALTTLPYFALKVSWLVGMRTGLNDPEFGHSGAMFWLNFLTMMLDVVALVLAVIFLTRRGLRAPAWLVLPPMWIGAGLLGQILLALPLAMIVDSVSPSHPPTDEIPPLDEWVYSLVYAGFAGLGIGLLGAFAIYARQRWGGRSLPPVTPRARRSLRAAAGLIAVAGIVHAVVSAVPVDARLLDLVVAGVTATALLALTRPTLRGRLATATVIVAFMGTGAVVAWGTYLGVITAVPNELVGQTETDWATIGGSALRAVAGFVGIAALAARLTRGARDQRPLAGGVPR